MKVQRIEIAPSILAADFRRLEREVKEVEQAGADRIHCDIMDGHFVPAITFGPLVVECVRRSVSLPLDVHLMISNPRDHIRDFCHAGASFLTVHAEVCPDIPGIMKEIRSHNVAAGITVNPDAPVDLFLPYLNCIDQVLIMTVYAGRGGQQFIPETVPKINAVAQAARQTQTSLSIEVDGGINEKTAGVCVQNGATVVVAGSFIFGAPDYRERIVSLRNAVQ